MLRGIGSTNLHIELVAAVATADDNGAANEGTEGFEDFLAELLQHGDVLGGTELLIPQARAVAERSNSASVKCSESCNDFIRI